MLATHATHTSYSYDTSYRAAALTLHMVVCSADCHIYMCFTLATALCMSVPVGGAVSAPRPATAAAAPLRDVSQVVPWTV